MGVSGGLGVSVGFLGVFLINGGRIGVLRGLRGEDRGFEGFMGGGSGF